MKTTWAVVVWGIMSAGCVAGESPWFSSDDGFRAARDAGASNDVADVEVVPVDADARQPLDAAQVDDVVVVDGNGAQAEAQVPPEAQPNGVSGREDAEAATCGWSPYSDGLSGAAMIDVLYDLRAAPGTVYATTAQNIYQSTDSGFTWHLQGSSSAGNLEFLSAPGSDPNFFLASSGNGVLTSNDAGKTWSVLSFEGVGTSYVAAAPSQPLRVYASVPGAGIFRSDDGGSAFSSINNGVPFGDAIAMDIAPDSADDALAVMMLINAQNAWSDSVVVRTTDGGNTWNTVLSGAGYSWNVRRCAANADIVYVATADGVARSQDHGATFTVIPTQGLVEDVEISPADCNDVYVMIESDGVHHSIDGGHTLGATLSQGLNLVPPGTWPGRMAVDPRGSHVVVGSHGGIWASDTPVSSWTLAQGILGISINALGSSAAFPGEVWLASWGSGIWHRASSAQPWTRIASSVMPDDYTFTVVPDPVVPGRVFVGSWSTLYESFDDSTFFATSLADNELAIAFDPRRHNVVYVGTQVAGLFKSTDSGATFVASNTGIAPWTTATGSSLLDVRSIAIDPSSPDTVFIGTNGAGIYKSVDGAQSWTQVAQAGQVVTSLLAVSGAVTTEYAYVSGHGIQRSVNGAATWTDVSAGLPSLDVQSLVVDSATGYLYVSSGGGVYVKRGEAPWSEFDLPCLDGAGASTVVTEGAARRLVVASSEGVFTHSL